MITLGKYRYLCTIVGNKSFKSYQQKKYLNEIKKIDEKP